MAGPPKTPRGLSSLLANPVLHGKTNRPYRGCGTSQAAKHAQRWPQAQITGIDCSATSVRRTEDLKGKYNLNNLQVHQLAVERVNELGMSFDQIVCTGVLHHLVDPDAGLRALRSVLNPDGAMHLMVYAPYGRTGIYMLQEFCRRVGIHATDGEIRDLMGALGALPPGHPLESILSQAPDFQLRHRLPMPYCIRRTVRIPSRNCLTSSRREG